jgi:hypothetical protein
MCTKCFLFTRQKRKAIGTFEKRARHDTCQSLADGRQPEFACRFDF